MDAVPVPGASREDLDMDAVRRYMRAAVETGRRSFAADEDPWDVLKKLEWVKSETEITRAAYLLFAKDPQLKFPQAIVHAGAFRDGGALILDSFDARGNIQDQIEATLAFVKRNIRRSIVVSAKAEHDRFWEYPIEALRETLTNAVCHRDYGSTNDIQLKILEDRLIVYSPGQLPFDMSLASLVSQDHPSRPRNKLIAQAFYDIHLIEHYGSGIRRIKNDCDKNGNLFPQWIDEGGFFSTTYFPRGASGKVGERQASGEVENPPHDPTNETGGPRNSGFDPTNEPTNGTQEPIKEPIKLGKEPISARVLEHIRQHPGEKRDGIVKALGISLSTARRALKALGGQVEYRGSKKTGGYFAKDE
jgi:predicted HTH transcriptional regulator